jgi:hypothetical protein
MRSAEHYNTGVVSGGDERIATRRLHALEIWQFINIFLLSLVTGVFWGTWLGLSRSMSTLSAETFLEVAHAMIGNLATIMAILMPIAMLSTLPVLYLLYRRRPKRFYATLIGFLLFVVALLITLLVEVPLDFQFQQWTLPTLPANWQQLRDRWEWFHFLRSWIAVFGLALLLAGALFWRDITIQLRPDQRAMKIGTVTKQSASYFE